MVFWLFRIVFEDFDNFFKFILNKHLRSIKLYYWSIYVISWEGAKNLDFF